MDILQLEDSLKGRLEAEKSMRRYWNNPSYKTGNYKHQEKLEKIQNQTKIQKYLFACIDDHA